MDLQNYSEYVDILHFLNYLAEVDHKYANIL